ncbi:MAG: hypothetical protein HOE90_24860 [Bacteriovoracaceae bacterium]|jgi:triacylglycerol lipase|nr:hypothetical protein [Bacteriovoracaceae bacterium]
MRKTIKRPPVIFCHGFGVNWQLYEVLLPLKKLFSDHGMKLLIARTPFMNTLQMRAETLDKEVKRLVPHGEFHLIGHSMGGLDARHAICNSDWAGRCLSLTTVSTPHKGSAIAEEAERLIHTIDKIAHKNVFKMLPIVDKLSHFATSSLQSFKQLHPEYMVDKFNPQNPDHDKVKYFSLNFFVPKPFINYSVVHWMKLPYDLYHKTTGRPNDGLVCVESSTWGESLGVFEGDHYSQTGPIPFNGKLQYKETFQKIIDNLIKSFPEESEAG